MTLNDPATGGSGWTGTLLAGYRVIIILYHVLTRSPFQLPFIGLIRNAMNFNILSLSLYLPQECTFRRR